MYAVALEHGDSVMKGNADTVSAILRTAREQALKIEVAEYVPGTGWQPLCLDRFSLKAN